MERTLALIKPDVASVRFIVDFISKRVRKAGLKIVKSERVYLTLATAEKLYSRHSRKHFFRELVHFMVSGPIVIMLLEGDHAITEFRKLMGDTDPEKASSQTFHWLMGTSILRNAVHGSSNQKAADREIAILFPEFKRRSKKK